MPDPARLARRSVAAAERTGLSKLQAKSAVLEVIATVGQDLAAWPGPQDETIIAITGWLRQVWSGVMGIHPGPPSE